jgi:hypothetical protein
MLRYPYVYINNCTYMKYFLGVIAFSSHKLPATVNIPSWTYTLTTPTALNYHLLTKTLIPLVNFVNLDGQTHHMCFIWRFNIFSATFALSFDCWTMLIPFGYEFQHLKISSIVEWRLYPYLSDEVPQLTLVSLFKILNYPDKLSSKVTLFIFKIRNPRTDLLPSHAWSSKFWRSYTWSLSPRTQDPRHCKYRLILLFS